MKVTRNIDTGDEKQTIRTISTKPKEHFEGRWKSGRLYPLYSVVVNNGTTFISQNAKMKEEPYVIYDADKKEFKAPDGWLIKEMSADSRVTALGGGGEGGVTPEEVEEMIKDKVDKVGGKGLSTNDYDNTEKNKVASAYQKPDNGIPKSDLAKAVQDVLDDADGAYKMPVTGIPFADLADGVQDSLSNADAAYQKPSSGVPKTDLASGVQDSLDLADTSVQAEPVGPIIAPPETDDFATKTSVEEIEAKVDNITGTILEGSSTPYPANTVFMQYPQVKPGDVVYMTLKNTNGAAQAVQFYDTNDTSLGSSYIYGWGGGGVLDEEKSYVIKIPNNYGYAKTLWGHGIAILHLSRFSGTIVDEILNSEEHSDFRDDLLDEMKVGNNPGVNLIDPNAPDTRIGYYLKPNNEFVSNADYNTTGFVPVVAGSTLTFPSHFPKKLSNIL